MNKPIQHATGLRQWLLALACAAGASSLYATALCTVDAESLTFPPYDVFNPAPTLSTSAITVRCLGVGSTASATVALGISAGTYGTVTDRKMAQLAGGAGYLRYGIYSDSNRTQNWGDGPDAPTRSSGPLDTQLAIPVIFSLYGSMPPLQNVAPGGYFDSLLITVSP